MSTSLYVSNLPSTATEEMLKDKFAEFGTVLSVKLKRDPETGRMRCVGFVEMKTTQDAIRAVDGLNATRLEGRLVSVSHTVRG